MLWAIIFYPNCYSWRDVGYPDCTVSSVDTLTTWTAHTSYMDHMQCSHLTMPYPEERVVSIRRSLGLTSTSIYCDVTLHSYIKPLPLPRPSLAYLWWLWQDSHTHSTGVDTPSSLCCWDTLHPMHTTLVLHHSKYPSAIQTSTGMLCTEQCSDLHYPTPWPGNTAPWTRRHHWYLFQELQISIVCMLKISGTSEILQL